MKAEVAKPEDVQLRERILATARRLLFQYGYKLLTMDLLARELGMSKKTLYLHTAGKDALVEAVIHEFGHELRTMAQGLFEDAEVSYTVKLARFSSEISSRFERLPPHFFRELQRFAPKIYHNIEEMRSRSIPVIFGRLIAEGKRAGLVRDSVDPVFATEFWSAAMQGVMHPTTAERMGLRPDQVFTRAFSLYCGGLLTSKGMLDYEKQADV